MSRISHGASGRRWLMTTSSTIVFSTTGVSAATAWPRIDTPKATYTLRLCAIRNGSMRRSHPPASGGAGSGVGRSAACRALPPRTVVLPDGAPERGQAGDHCGAIIGRRAQYELELRGHGSLRLLERGRSGARDFETPTSPAAFHSDALYPPSALRAVRQTRPRRPCNPRPPATPA